GTYKILGANLTVLLSAIISNKIWHLISDAGILIKIGYVFGTCALLIVSYMLGLHFMKIDKGIAALVDGGAENG
ncbi:MAG: hypothetical protein HGA27_03610, partial [Peptococcaceae bacterium]|nr:hypothetical protein [Peptococcaceae bacterium]